MHRKFKPESGAFEFFPDPTDRLLMQVEQENRTLKARLDATEKRLEELLPPNFDDLDSDQVKQVAEVLEVSTGNSSRKSTLISKITESGKTDSEIKEAIKQIKG